jgi:hypothetical protein
MDEELRKLCWQAFLESGSPGYYMLYNKLNKENKKTR